MVLSDGTAKCFGNSNYGQLGQGSTDDLGDQANEMGDNLPAIDVGVGLTVASMSAGNHYTCKCISLRIEACAIPR